ncbi:MAG TPA: cupin domain-containing protein [Dehalococcoidia bacterium]|jgi:quercetin dioxygenase-like cupin family protein|nr:cupin domain-containing protein [Dehalococcoidia bacterium]
MRIVHRDEVEPAREDDLKFTGRVERRDLLPPQQHAGLRLGWVRFERGARTNWHTHDGEQVLYVIDGEGCVGTHSETVPIGPGDVVRIPAEEKHWHGARSGGRLVHIAITSGVETRWPKPPDRPAPCEPTVSGDAHSTRSRKGTSQGSRRKNIG